MEATARCPLGGPVGFDEAGWVAAVLVDVCPVSGLGLEAGERLEREGRRPDAERSLTVGQCPGPCRAEWWVLTRPGRAAEPSWRGRDVVVDFPDPDDDGGAGG